MLSICGGMYPILTLTSQFSFTPYSLIVSNSAVPGPAPTMAHTAAPGPEPEHSSAPIAEPAIAAAGGQDGALVLGVERERRTRQAEVDAGVGDDRMGGTAVRDALHERAAANHEGRGHSGALASIAHGLRTTPSDCPTRCG